MPNSNKQRLFARRLSTLVPELTVIRLRQKIKLTDFSQKCWITGKQVEAIELGEKPLKWQQLCMLLTVYKQKLELKIVDAPDLEEPSQQRPSSSA